MQGGGGRVGGGGRAATHEAGLSGAIDHTLMVCPEAATFTCEVCSQWNQSGGGDGEDFENQFEKLCHRVSQCC